MMTDTPTPLGAASEVKALLTRLAEWEGRGNADRSDRKSTGESEARIADLKAKLAARGAFYHWDGERYVLDGLKRTSSPSSRPSGDAN